MTSYGYRYNVHPHTNSSQPCRPPASDCIQEEYCQHQCIRPFQQPHSMRVLLALGHSMPQDTHTLYGMEVPSPCLEVINESPRGRTAGPYQKSPNTPSSPLGQGVGEDANAGPGVALGHLHVRRARHRVPAKAVARSVGRVEEGPPELVLPIGHLLPQRPHHELLHAQRAHLPYSAQGEIQALHQNHSICVNPNIKSELLASARSVRKGTACFMLLPLQDATFPSLPMHIVFDDHTTATHHGTAKRVRRG